MKYGMRKPSWKKSLPARTKGRHPCGQAGADPRLRQEGHGVAASQAQTVQRHLQEDHVQPVRPVQVVGNRVIARTNHHAIRCV